MIEWIVAIIIIIALFIGALVILKKMKGNIDIIPERYNYSPGENIKGRIILKLKKPVEADSLSIRLIGEMQRRMYSADGKLSTRTTKIFDFSQPLEMKKNYAPSEYTYEFNIKIPSNILTKPQGTLGAVIGAADFLSGQSRNIRWHLISSLDCKGLNLSRKVQINIA